MMSNPKNNTPSPRMETSNLSRPETALHDYLEQQRLHAQRTKRKANQRVQFAPEQIYISPFTQRRITNAAGQAEYVATERNLTPTGVWVVDECLCAFAAGKDPAETIRSRYGLTVEMLSAVFFALTGRTYQAVRDAYMMRVADELLRYTDLTMGEVARRAGFSTPQFFTRVISRTYGTTPTKRRRALRREGDRGRYAL